MKKYILFISVAIQLNFFAMEKEEEYLNKEVLFQILEKAKSLEPEPMEPPGQLYTAFPSFLTTCELLYKSLKNKLEVLHSQTNGPIEFLKKKRIPEDPISYFSLLPRDIPPLLLDLIILKNSQTYQKHTIDDHAKVVYTLESEEIPLEWNDTLSFYKTISTIVCKTTDPCENILAIDHLFYCTETKKLVVIESYVARSYLYLEGGEQREPWRLPLSKLYTKKLFSFTSDADTKWKVFSKFCSLHFAELTNQ